MEVTFSELKQKDIININDGKHLGKPCDVTFSFPEGKVAGITVTGCKGFRFSRQEVFIPLKCIVKVGEDVILVKIGDKEDGVPPCPPPCPPDGKRRPPRPVCPPENPCDNRRDFGEYE